MSGQGEKDLIYTSEETKTLRCLVKIGLFCPLSKEQHRAESSQGHEEGKKEGASQQQVQVRGATVNGKMAELFSLSDIIICPAHPFWS